LGIKNRALRQFGKTALPFLTQSANGDTYFRIESCCGIINVAGFNEAIESFTCKPLYHEECLKFAKEIVQNTRTFVAKIGRKHGKRISLAILHSPEASSRLAQLDIERYGVARVKFLGTRDKPFYSTTMRVQLQPGNFLSVPSEQLDELKALKGWSSGGTLTAVEMNGSDIDPENLAKLTTSLMQNHGIEFFTYSRSVTYCGSCQKSWLGKLHRCPSCGSMGTLVGFDGFDGT
jgi:anaerobic ribonucleoside-triphosphate reductase